MIIIQITIYSGSFKKFKVVCIMLGKHMSPWAAHPVAQGLSYRVGNKNRPLYVPSHSTADNKIFQCKVENFKRIEKIMAAATLAPLRGSGAPAIIFSIFLNLQLCIERFFDSTTPKQYTFKPEVGGKFLLPILYNPRGRRPGPAPGSLNHVLETFFSLRPRYAAYLI